MDEQSEKDVAKLVRKKGKKTAFKKDAAWIRKKMSLTEGLEPGEIANGWKAHEVKAYLEEADRRANRKLGLNSEEPIAHRNMVQNSDGYDPHGW